MQISSEYLVNVFSLVFLLLATSTLLRLQRTITLAATAAGCGEYWDGDWIIDTSCQITDETIDIGRNLEVLNTGQLELIEATNNLLFGFRYRRAITISNLKIICWGCLVWPMALA